MPCFLAACVPALLLPASGSISVQFAIGTEFLPIACRDEWLSADGAVFHHRGNRAILTVYLSPYRFLKIWLKRKYGAQEVVTVDGSIMDRIMFGTNQKAWLIIFDAGPIHEVGTFLPGKLLRFLRQLLIGLIHSHHSCFRL